MSELGSRTLANEVDALPTERVVLHDMFSRFETNIGNQGDRHVEVDYGVDASGAPPLSYACAHYRQLIPTLMQDVPPRYPKCGYKATQIPEHRVSGHCVGVHLSDQLTWLPPHLVGGIP